MTSKTSSIKWGKELRETYVWSLKRSRGMMALMTALLFLALPAVLLFALANANIRMDEMTLNAYSIASQYASVFEDAVRISVPMLAVPVCALFTILFAVQLFRYIHQKRSVDLFHALPVRRSAMLTGRILAGLTALFVPLLLNTGVAAVIALCFDIQDKGTQIADLFVKILGLLLVLTAAFLFCTLMAVCTGTTLDMVLSVIGVNIAYPILVYSSFYLISCLLPGFSMSVDVNVTLIAALSPFTAFFLAPEIIRSPDAASFFVWWAIFSVFLAVLCVYLYRRRKSESAENTFAFQIPKGLIRFLITAVGGFALGFILFWYYSSTVNFLIGMLLGSLAAHIVVEAIYSRGFSRMLRSFAGYAVFLGAFIVFYGVVCTGAFGYVDRMPQLDEIESVSFENYTYYQEFGSDSFVIQGERYENLATLSPTIRQPEELKKVLSFHRAVIDFQREAGYPYRMSRSGNVHYNITYNLKNGSVFHREYSMYNESNYRDPSEELQVLSREIVNSEEYKTSGNLLFYLEPEEISQVEVQNYDKEEGTTSKTYRLNGEQKEELLAALRQDTLEMDVTGHDEYREDNVEMFLVCGENGLFQPAEDGKLKALVGEYKGKIRVPSNLYNLRVLQDSRTEQFLEKQGWLDENS